VTTESLPIQTEDAVPGSELVRLDPAKFNDPHWTATGEPRAWVELKELATLWFNTGTLCNLTCESCYIESSPTNDKLAHITVAEVIPYLNEIADNGWPTREIGFTGGEPFMNPEIIEIMEACLARDFRVLMLTNAMRPMMKLEDALLSLLARYGARLTLRVSLDHYTQELHKRERGPHSWDPTLHGLRWLAENGFALHVAGRTRWHEADDSLRAGYARFFAEKSIPVDAYDVTALVLFPEMDANLDVVEITEACWRLLGVDPAVVMCASSRMIVKRKGAARPVVLPCTLLPYDTQFELGETLAEAERITRLNHPHCARFCVLRGGSCSAGP
jgi:uncharacterized Fe-S cluster-containing radical SAM superfamily protein